MARGKANEAARVNGGEGEISATLARLEDQLDAMRARRLSIAREDSEREESRALEIRATNGKTADGGNAYNGLSIEHQKTKTEGKIWQSKSPP